MDIIAEHHHIFETSCHINVIAEKKPHINYDNSIIFEIIKIQVCDVVGCQFGQTCEFVSHNRNLLKFYPCKIED